MEELSWLSLVKDLSPGSSCAYILGNGRGRHFCGEAPRRGSPYCAQHHTLCHVAGGTTAEAQRLREVEALARAVGGRRASGGTGPSRQFINRMEQALQAYS